MLGWAFARMIDGAVRLYQRNFWTRSTEKYGQEEHSMNITNIGMNAAYFSRLAQPIQDKGIIIVGGKTGGAPLASPALKKGIIVVGGRIFGDTFNRVALNPQPLPPKEAAVANPSLSHFLAGALNPQPLPPKPNPDPGPYAGYALRRLVG
jgi:hypothetical protein